LKVPFGRGSGSWSSFGSENTSEFAAWSKCPLIITSFEAIFEQIYRSFQADLQKFSSRFTEVKCSLNVV
jgi:hypothetical protein